MRHNMQLYDYYRSSCSYRVRIALNIKKLNYTAIPVHLISNDGEQHKPEYKKINPQEIVPTLITSDGAIKQSLAIIDYLDELYPKPALLPSSPFARSVVKSLALIIACEIHPLNNLRVLQTLKRDFQISEQQKLEWYHKWLELGFSAFESNLQELIRKKDVCFGDSVTLADICLIPQVYNAKRFNFPMSNYPLISKINDYCLSLTEFSSAAPDK